MTSSSGADNEISLDSPMPIFNESSTLKPIRVAGVVTTGTDHIDPSVLQAYLDDTIMKSITLGQLVKNADVLNKRLCQHHIALNAKQSFHFQGNTYISDEKERHDVVPLMEVVSQLDILPPKTFTAKTGTNFGNDNDAEAYLQFEKLIDKKYLKLPTRVNLEILRGTKIHSSFLFNSYSSLSPQSILNLKVFSQFYNWNTNKGLDIGQRGARLSLRYEPLFLHKLLHNPHSNESPTLFHEWFLETCWRSTKICSQGTSAPYMYSGTMLSQAGDQLRTILGHTFVLDKRDHIMCPTKGSMLKWSNELSPGKHLKTQLELNSVKSWMNDDFITFSTTIKTGYLKNLSSQQSLPVHICDKFQSGGPSDIRGFQTFGLGPRDLYDAVGGDAFVSYGLSVFSRLPWKKVEKSNFRLHWFFNGGKLVNHDNTSLGNCIGQLSKEHSTSTGIGLVLRHPMARFELNFTLPITAHENDLIRKGFQFGLGLAFL
ncbi:BAH_G0045830.mRNA.1.CDS.1 [Saccharomyces cerevisiae]|nr:SX2_G0012070.mRNA.1.CDS.1 [Saccharomyces cerevisiae]CAI4713603.1 BAH_G0045830.mRNA.1.CDS.1 [Saccharomyces cerevisiae]CAI4717461.1 BAG_1a_G0045800.mRNA.1.CDS.1 [Saccharomyces cerevisiae]CAI7289569.1 BAG_1a_G0045800.mRNA.1.CDS.1 [Saccharomyces cerevisiae]CAI7292305.1 BAH_G0045830.mRNA.1.CDS.1 [Saccharomyces cerevisiae]